MKTDTFGDRMKTWEMAEAGRMAMPGLPLIARLDGRAFHTFTRGMKRPYDMNMMIAMEIATKELVDEFQANVGYTQSDEITLLFTGDGIPFKGRFQKLTSVLAGYASAVFAREASVYWPEKRIIPCFDCRVWNVPNLDIAKDVFAWREADAVKNSVQMAAQSVASHKQLSGKNRGDQMDILHAKGINWNDYPVHFKRGVYAKRVVESRWLTPEELARIPEQHRPTEKVWRGEVRVLLDFPPIQQASAGQIEWLLGRSGLALAP